MADVKFEAVNLALPTVGNYDFTISGFGTPKGAFLLGGNEAAGTQRTGISFSFGWTDFGAGDSEGYISVREQDGLTTTDNGRAMADNSTLYNRSPSGTVETSIREDSALTDTARFVKSVTQTAGRWATGVLFGGADVTHSFCYEHRPYAHSNPFKLVCTDEADGVTTFEPDVVFAFTNGAPASSNNVANLGMCIGICVNDGTDKQHCVSISAKDNVTTSDVTTAVYDDKIVLLALSKTLDWSATVGNFVSDGFDVTTSGALGTDGIYFLALKFANSPSINLEIIDSPTTTGSYSTSFTDHTPDFAMLFLSDATSVNTPQSGDGFAVSFFDGTTEVCHSISSEDGVTTSNASSVWNTTAIKDYVAGGDTLLHEGTFTNFNSSGYTLNMTTAPGTARKWMSFSIGTEPAAAPAGQSVACIITT